VPAPVKLASDGEADFPAMAVNKEGRIAVAFQEFLGDHDRLAVRFFAPGSTASATIEASNARDVFRPAIAYDGAGVLHVIWSGQDNGNWDLWEARYDGGKFTPPERLTQSPEADMHQKVIGDARGNLWLAWQGFRNGQSDIFLKRWSQGKWGAEIKVS